MSATLYQMTDQLAQFLAVLEDPEIELDEQAVFDTLEGLEGAVDEKLINVAIYIEELENRISGMKWVVDRATVRKKAIESRAAWLERYLIDNFTRAKGVDGKIESPEVNIKLARNPASVFIVDEALIPAKYFVEKPAEIVIDKKAIKADGGCEGAEVKSSGYRLVLK